MTRGWVARPAAADAGSSHDRNPGRSATPPCVLAVLRLNPVAVLRPGGSRQAAPGMAERTAFWRATALRQLEHALRSLDDIGTPADDARLAAYAEAAQRVGEVAPDVMRRSREH
jgi:hypothetical protein